MSLNPETLPSIDSSPKKIGSGPVAAAGRLKGVTEQVQLMKRRVEVLRQQEEYNSYKTMEQ